MQSQLLFWDQLRKLELASRQMMDKGSLSLQQKTTSYKKNFALRGPVPGDAMR